MCLPELLTDIAIQKGSTVKLSVISAAPCQRCQIHITDCDVMFPCNVIKDTADIEHNGLGWMGKVSLW